MFLLRCGGESVKVNVDEKKVMVLGGEERSV